MTLDRAFFLNQAVASPPDLLGPLRGFVGTNPSGKAASRTWRGRGFNMIWRPNHKQSGTKPYFLQLMFIDDEISFTEIVGAIANRGLLQDDIAIGGVSYMQQITDVFDGSGQHVEPGVWLNVPGTKNPAVAPSVVRMGSIPHGTTINLQGEPVQQNPPVFPVLSCSPHPIGSPANRFDFPEEDLSRPSTSRTRLEQVVGLDQAHLDNLALFLSDALSGQTVIGSTLLEVISTADDPALVGGGVDNIAFLTGVGSPPTGGSNALTSFVEAAFWIERVKGIHGPDFDQLQYYQQVQLDFMGLSFPHITVATLTEHKPHVEESGNV
jgi:hypothetical protein